MHVFFAVFITVMAAYLLGSLNFAIVISKWFHHRDIRTLGSGNAGMTNMLRNFGKRAAVLTLVGDIGKGILAVFIGRWVFAGFLSAGEMFYGAYIAGICAILGHMFPLYFGFRGGKGVAVSGGVIICLNPLLAVLLVCVFLAVALASRMVSLGSIIGIGLYPVSTFLYSHYYSGQNTAFTTSFAAIVALLVIAMHRDNIRRIKNGTERKIGEKKKQ